jgi:hypothetical protein
VLHKKMDEFIGLVHKFVLVWAQPFLPLLEIDVEAPSFVATDDVGQKRWMLTSKAMTGEQRSTEG